MRPTLLALVLVAPLGGCVLPDGDFDGDGWDTLDGDCDDDDAAIHPGAQDAVGDGVDQDCDGANPMEVERGKSHDCVLDLEGSVVCEGDDSRGQLDLPDAVDGRRFVQIAAGWWHTCALDEDGYVVCWGDDRFGQASAPEAARFVSIDADANYSIGIGELGFAVCWGRCINVR